MRGRTFQKVCERIPDALVVAHPEGQLVWFNDAFRHLLGVDQDALRWKPFLDFVHPEDQERMKDAYLTLFARKFPIRAFPLRLVQPKGELVHVLWSAAVDPRSRLVYSILTDVTGRVLEAEERTRILSEVHRRTPAMMFQVGDDGRILEVSDTLLARTGYDRIQLIGSYVSQWLPRSIWQRAHWAFDRLRREGELRETPLEMIHRDGSVLEVLVSANASRDGNGDFVGAWGVIEDVTVRNDALRQLDLERSVLEQRNHELNEFARVISHDLREPLRAIRLLTSWIETDFETSDVEQMVERLGRLRSRVCELDRYVEALSTYVRAGAEGHPAELVDLRELIANVAEVVPVPDTMSLERCGTAMLVRTARAPLEQVLVNLVGNAVAHRDRADGTIVVSTHGTDDGIRVVVRDDGPGIAPEFHEAIFEMGRRLKAAGSGHTGLGLTLVKKLVESRGGTIRVDSDTGRGSVFEFTWPAEIILGTTEAPRESADEDANPISA
ncbi:MAG: PAS domain-containing sensor histidine kinase [Candidatus Eisenbacteria bacterium]